MVKHTVVGGFFEALIAVVVLFAGVADAVTTVIGLHRGAHEANPTAAWLFAHLGIEPALLLRVALPVVAARWFLRWARRDRVIYLSGVVGIIVVVALWCAVAMSNAFQLA